MERIDAEERETDAAEKDRILAREMYDLREERDKWRKYAEEAQSVIDEKEDRKRLMQVHVCRFGCGSRYMLRDQVRGGHRVGEWAIGKESGGGGDGRGGGGIGGRDIRVWGEE